MYKCTNKNCKQYNKEHSPGGRMKVVNGRITYTGSICKSCDQEMEECTKEGIPNISIVNPSDGRNL